MKWLITEYDSFEFLYELNAVHISIIFDQIFETKYRYHLFRKNLFVSYIDKDKHEIGNLNEYKHLMEEYQNE